MSPVIPARALVGAAVSAVAFAALTVPAGSAEVAVDCAADNTALVAAAETAVADAKAVRLAANRPLGLLMQAERRETRTEVRIAREALQELRAEARDRDLTDEERAVLVAAVDEQSAALRHAMRLLESKRALLAEIKAGREEAKAALADARSALAELRAALDACAVDEETVDGDQDTDEDVDVDDAP